jgi:uncharacterized membrane protein
VVRKNSSRRYASSSNAGRIAIAVLFVVAGSLQFLFAVPYLRIIPPVPTWPKALISISGTTEILESISRSKPTAF